MLRVGSKTKFFWSDLFDNINWTPKVSGFFEFIVNLTHLCFSRCPRFVPSLTGFPGCCDPTQHYIEEPIPCLKPSEIFHQLNPVQNADNSPTFDWPAASITYTLIYSITLR